MRTQARSSLTGLLAYEEQNISKDRKDHQGKNNYHAAVLKNGYSFWMSGFSAYHFDKEEDYHSAVKNGQGKEIHHAQGDRNQRDKIGE